MGQRRQSRVSRPADAYKWTRRSSLHSRAVLQLEVLALRHQLQLLNRSRRPRLWLAADRLLWVWLARIWLVIIKPECQQSSENAEIWTASQTRERSP